nr:uncharacterized protein LOC110003673 isoform X3 [Labrus bergylta]
MSLSRHSALLCGQVCLLVRSSARFFSCSQTGPAAPPRGKSFAPKSRAVTLRSSSHNKPESRVMPSNVEIKASVSDRAQFAKKAALLSQSEGTIIKQHDTFFNCSQGRLKLRDFMVRGNRASTCERHLVATAVLADALGVKGEVKKERTLFLIGQTRVHLDTVEGLGNYMELEVVMRPEQTVEEGQQIAEDLMEKLGVSKESLVTGAYMDLLLKGHKET